VNLVGKALALIEAHALDAKHGIDENSTGD
jgi:hypothetical protein